jgi:hypothetical protein
MDPKSSNKDSSMKMQLECSEILSLDNAIRFVGMCSKEGKLLNVKYRDEITPLISDRELLYSIIKSVERNAIRKETEDKLGPALYSVTAYANVKRATISANGGLVFVSFEGKGNENSIVNKILEKLEESTDDEIYA